MISDKIRELRTEKGLSQKELAEQIKSTSKNIWAYENNISTPPLDVLKRLADFFEVSIDYLAEREDDFGVVKTADGDVEELVALYSALMPATQEAIKETLKQLLARQNDLISEIKKK